MDDEKLLLKSISKALSQSGYGVVTAENGAEALKRYEKENPDLMLLDVRLPDMDGMRVLGKIKKMDPHCPVIVMTAYSGIKGAVEAVKLGAYDYIAKPFDIEELKFILSRCLESQKAVAEVKQIRSSKKERYGFDRILTRNSRMKQLIELSRRVSGTPSTVLIQGESGTGKELFANAIHYNGSRQDHPFIAVNCVALSEGVLESELFGHEKGAFTGAIKQKKGLFELADRGTLFLDEIGEVNPQAQIKLLRFLEERNFQRVGGTESIEVDVRIIAATNKDLLKAVKEKRFREDLYYRLSVISFSIPSLRARKEDMNLLVNHFIEEYKRILNKHVRGCSKEALSLLSDYDWPGNIRELRNIIERAVLLCDDEWITPCDIPLETAENGGMSRALKIDALDPMPLDHLIRRYAERILERCGDNKTKAAEALAITRQRLRRVLNIPPAS